LEPEDFNVAPKFGRDVVLPGLADFLGSPLGQFWMMLMFVGGVLILVTIFFPSFWVLLFGWLSGRKAGTTTRKGRSKS
jgi:hypothetical protein